MKRNILLFGSIAGLILAVFLAAVTIAFRNSTDSMVTSMFFGYAIMLLAFSVIFVAVKNYRDKHLDGTISFGNALALGLGISLIASLFYVITWMILYATVVPDFMDKYAAMQVQQLQKAGKSAAEIQSQLKEMESYKEMYKTWYGRAGITFLEIAPVALIVPLICAATMMRRKKKIKTA